MARGSPASRNRHVQAAQGRGCCSRCTPCTPGSAVGQCAKAHSSNGRGPQGRAEAACAPVMTSKRRHLRTSSAGPASCAAAARPLFRKHPGVVCGLCSCTTAMLCIVYLAAACSLYSVVQYVLGWQVRYSPCKQLRLVRTCACNGQRICSLVFKVLGLEATLGQLLYGPGTTCNIQ
jgi:hypothetical protein